MAVTTFKNIRDNKSGTLLTAITASQTTLTLNTGQGASFPAAPFYISCDFEVMICTAKVGDVFTVTRGADNTIAAIHAAGSLVEMRSVAALWNDLAAAINALENSTNILNTPHWISPIVDSGGLTITLGDLTVSAGNIVMGAAASQIIPGATSFSIRNNGNNADNLLVSDAGLTTIRNGLRVSAGNMGVGSAPATNVSLTVTGTVNASGAVAYGEWIPATLVAQVNGDTLAGMSINPTFNDNGKTGVIHLGLDIAAGGIRVSAGGLTVSSGTVNFSGATVSANLPNISIAPAAANINGGAGTWTDIPGSTVTVPAGTYLIILQLGTTTGANADTPEIGLSTSASNSGGNGLIVTSNQTSAPGGGYGTTSGVGIAALNGSYKLQVFSSTTTSTGIAKAVLTRIL